MKLIFKMLTFAIILASVAIPSNEVIAQEWYNYEYQHEGVNYIVVQADDNPIWLKAIPDKAHMNLSDVTIPEVIQISDQPYVRNVPHRPAIVKKIDARAFRYSQINSIVIPSSVEMIGDMAFYNSEITKVTFSKGLVRIGESAFMACFNLGSVILPESVMHLESSCFAMCSGLKEVDLPSTLLSLGGFTFNFSGAIEKIICRAVVPPTADTTDFGVIENNPYYYEMLEIPQFRPWTCKLYVPAGSEEAYRNAPGWKLFYHIEAIDENPTTDVDSVDSDDNQIEYKVVDGTLTVACRANDVIHIYDPSGICLDAKEFTSPAEYRYSGKGVTIVNLNNKSVKVNL
ncbi:MAG: leucine-rich repeat domain-containing protein [Muribaculaceae bacterium]|nr:leucine-rich repeat domain-containing protein [Muribaculaceae bacterium]